MRTARSVGATALTIITLGAGLALLTVPAHAAPVTCQGKPATVVGSTGTEGDDVMVVVPTEGTIAQALGGNDTICIVAAPEGGIRSVVVDAGPGNDAVVNESTDVDDVWYTVVLGQGADSYAGLDAAIPDNPKASPFVETVYAGVRDDWYTGVGGTSDTETDAIDTRGGDDEVYTGSTRAGAVNSDVVRTGAGDDRIHWAGTQAGPGPDLGSGDADNWLYLYPGWQADSVDVDAVTHAATGDGRSLLRWTGDVAVFDLMLDNRDQRFSGTDADEVLILTPPGNPAPTSATPGATRTVSMGGGDDIVTDYSFGAGRVDGGAGNDQFSGSSCLRTRVRLGGTLDCVPYADPAIHHSFTFDGWEDLLLRGSDVSVVGTSRSEKIKVIASGRIRVRALGGDDVVNANASGRLAGDRPVVLSGGAGADRLVGSSARDRLLGGRGDDKLFGEARSDTLLGGPGRDKAFGQGGRDRCASELQRSCTR